MQLCFLSAYVADKVCNPPAAKLPSALLRSHKAAGAVLGSVMAHLWRQINNLCALQVSRFALEAFAKFTCASVCVCACRQRSGDLWRAELRGERPPPEKASDSMRAAKIREMRVAGRKQDSGKKAFME